MPLPQCLCNQVLMKISPPGKPQPAGLRARTAARPGACTFQQPQNLLSQGSFHSLKMSKYTDADVKITAELMGWRVDEQRTAGLARNLCSCGFAPSSPGAAKVAALSYVHDPRGTEKEVLGLEDASAQATGEAPTLGAVRRVLQALQAKELPDAENTASLANQPPPPPAAAAAALAAGGGGGAAGGALTGALPPQPPPPQQQQQRQPPTAAPAAQGEGMYQLKQHSLVHNILMDQVAVMQEEEGLVWVTSEGAQWKGGVVRGGLGGELTADGQRHLADIEQRLLSSSKWGWVRSFWPSLAGLGGEETGTAHEQLLRWIHVLMRRRRETRGTSGECARVGGMLACV